MHKMFHAQNRKRVLGGLGYLYNRYAYADVNFAPLDWEVPIVDDLNTLRDSLSIVDDVTGYNQLALNGYWLGSCPPQNNLSELSLIGSGYREYSSDYKYLNQRYLFCTLTDADISFNAVFYWLQCDLTTSVYFGSVEGLGSNGGSVRLIYRGAGTPTTVTDYDSNIYDVVQIGSQYWTKQNWKCTHLNDGTLIPTVTILATWNNLSTLAKCAYDNDENNV